MSSANQYNTSKSFFFLHSHPFSWSNIYVAVNVIDEHGYQGPLSDMYDLGSDESKYELNFFFTVISSLVEKLAAI